jgi:hypothetical protein
MSVLETLTEGIRSRSLANEGEALLQKWEKTGLLEGLNDVARNNMSRLLENQAAQLLKESSTMAGGDVEGFSAVAFPIVRRVFGNLLAQDLVSVQPMSLPSGLIFFMDFTFGNAQAASGAVLGESLYGGGKVAKQIAEGVDLGDDNAEKSFYGLNNGYSAATASAGNITATIADGPTITVTTACSALTAPMQSRVDGDPDLLAAAGQVLEVYIEAADVATLIPGLNRDNLVALNMVNTGGLAAGTIVRRLTRILANGDLSMILHNAAGAADAGNANTMTYNRADNLGAGGAIGSVVGDTPWALENEQALNEIDVKVDSLAVTAMTRKLKAKWSPELAQDLNAYHNLDAEVELTSILSEQIALEIDREILNDLVNGATGSTLHWSRSPGKFVDRETGVMSTGTNYPDFTGTVSEWYETLLETVNDVSARIHRKTLRGGANFLVCSPEVASILEFTSGFRASTAVDSDSAGSWGAQNIGSISRKMDIHVDPYFPRALILVGRKGSSFLESGYVYAPYVPLQVTPTIFGVEDFVPRKGVMTRYAKKMVRPDMYGVVVVRDLVADTADV